jgi:hypothetical protein
MLSVQSVQNMHIMRDMQATRDERSRQAATMTAKEERVYLLCSAWGLTGAFLDQWAHRTRARLETVLTPWHAVLYSGMLATTVWLYRVIVSRRAASPSWRDAIPPGYSASVIGLAVFWCAGAADLTWHSLFGIEKGLDAFLSPPHLLLLCGALLGLAGPFNANWHVVEGSTRRAVLSASLMSSMTLYFLSYANGLTSNASFQRVVDRARALDTYSGARFSPSRSIAALGLASILLTTLVLATPLALLLLRWRLPRGAIATALLVPTVFVFAAASFKNFPMALGPLGASILGEAIVARPRGARRSADGRWLLTLWSAFFGAAAVTRGIGWSGELVVGVTVLAAILSALLAAALHLASNGPGRSMRT